MAPKRAMHVSTSVKPPILLASTVLLITAYVLLAWSPFRWQVPDVHVNPVQALGDGGLQFEGAGIAQTRRPPAWVDSVARGAPFEIRLRVTPALTEQTGPARIFTVSKNTRFRNLTLGQAGTALVLRLRTDETDRNGQPPLVLHDAFRAGATTEIGVLAGPGLVRLEAGRAHVTRVVSMRPFQNWDLQHRVSLGNEFTGNRAWLGTIHKLTVQVGSETYDYLKPRALRVPRWRIDFHNDPLQDPFVDIEPGDGLRNFVGFIPLGLLLGALLKSRPRTAVVVALGSAFVVSGTLETGQFFLPGRSPSINDLILNTAGSLTGSMFVTAMSWRGRRRSA